MNLKVSIIILNWNGWKDTIECLESLYQITYPNYDVIVVDNGSEDDSIEKIKEYCEGKIEVTSKFFEYDTGNKPIKIIEYTREEAEAGGGKENEIADLPSNRKLILIKKRYALKALNTDYILLLNNDTVVDKGFLDELVKVAESDEKIGIVGPSIYSYYIKNMVQSMGVTINFYTGKRKFLSMNDLDDNKLQNYIESDYVSGCALLTKSEIVKKIGFLDSKYFAYCEEVEWCIRAKEIGYKIVCAFKTNIWHKESSSSKKNSGFKIYHYTRNNFWFMKKHASKKQHISFLLFFFGFYFWFKSGIFIVRHRDLNSLLSFLRGIIDGVKTER